MRRPLYDVTFLFERIVTVWLKEPDLSAYDIADRLGCSAITVYRAISKNFITLNEKGDNKYFKKQH